MSEPTPKVLVDMSTLTLMADNADRAQRLVDAQEHTLEAIQMRNAVDTGPAAVLTVFLRETIRTIQTDLGELRSPPDAA